MGRVGLIISDGAFDGDTATIPIRFTYEKWDNENYGDIRISVNSVSARQVGSRSVNGYGSGESWGTLAAQKGTGVGTLTISGSGFVTNQPFLVYGDADFYNSRTRESFRVAFSPVLTINVTPEQTSIIARVDESDISGRATVQSSVGVTGAGGMINVRYQEPGSSRWNRVTEFIECPDDSCRAVNPIGDFTLKPVTPIPQGSKVRVSLVDCGWCTPVTTTVKAR